MPREREHLNTAKVLCKAGVCFSPRRVVTAVAAQKLRADQTPVRVGGAQPVMSRRWSTRFPDREIMSTAGDLSAAARHVTAHVIVHLHAERAKLQARHLAI
jgi:hypothetical protein